SYIKNLLRLSDEALELADRHNIEEYKLRHVVTLPQDYHAEIVRQIVDFNLTSRQVKELCEGDGLLAKSSDPLEKLPAQAVKVAKVTQAISSTSPQDIARALMRQEGDPTIALGRIHALQKVLAEAERYLNDE